VRSSAGVSLPASQRVSDVPTLAAVPEGPVAVPAEPLEHAASRSVAVAPNAIAA
jgi:hypothetical protein